MKMTKKTAVLVAGVLLCTTGLGCYGRFALTRGLYSWNGQVTKNKFANSAIMWGLLIVPVYGFAAIIDLVVLNTMEVLTGKNPMASAEGQTIKVRYANRDFVLETNAHGIVEVHEQGHVVLRYKRDGDQILVYDDANHLIKTVDIPKDLAMAAPSATY